MDDDSEVPNQNPEVGLLINGTRFQCQRQLLSENSLYFDAMFKSGMIESSAEVIELKGVCPRAMEMIIRSLKTGQLDCPFHRLSSLLEAASMYQFATIQKRCVATLRMNLNVTNCLGIMFLANKFDIGDIYREAKQIALWNFEAVLREPEFGAISVKFVVEYLSHDGLRVPSEDVVFKSILYWMKQDEEERVQHYEELFSAVRFSSIDLKSLKSVAHDSFILKYPKMKRLVHEIWKIKFAQYVQSSNSPLSVSPLSDASPAEEECGNGASYSPPSGLEGLDYVPYKYPSPPRLAPPQLVPEDMVEKVLSHRLLSAGPRSLPMVPALVLFNSKDKSQAPILIYYDAELRKPVKIGSLKKVFHSCGKMAVVANGFKACTVGNCVYVVGGEFMMGHGDWNNSVWKYNTFLKSWSFLANLQNPRRHHELCVMDDCIYLIGGIGRFRVAQDTVQRLDISSGNISDLTPMPVPVTSAAVVAYQGKLYIFEALIYSYNAESNSWNCLKSVSLPHHGFHSALAHANGIYLVGRCTTQLILFCPECLENPYRKASISAVGSFMFPTENACIVGNKIYSFSKLEALFIESYDIEANVFTIEYSDMDGSFLGPQYQHGCFALPRYD